MFTGDLVWLDKAVDNTDFWVSTSKLCDVTISNVLKNASEKRP